MAWMSDAKGSRRAGRILLGVSAALFVVFLANVLLAFARARLGLDVTPLFGRVTEFLTLFMAALAFGAATLVHEREAEQNEALNNDV